MDTTNMSNFALPTLPQLHQTALLSTDFGSVYSKDGREHPVTSLIPVKLDAETVTQAASNVKQNLQQAGFGLPSLNPFKLPEHFGARAVVGIIAIGIILLVVWRLVKP